MTNAAATQITASIITDTVSHMAAQEGITAAQVWELLAQGHKNTVRRFNAYMEIATNYVRNN